MAETEGFEPSKPVSGLAHLANECLQPLGHVSVLRWGYSLRPDSSTPARGGGANLWRCRRSRAAFRGGGAGRSPPPGRCASHFSVVRTTLR